MRHHHEDVLCREFWTTFLRQNAKKLWYNDAQCPTIAIEVLIMKEKMKEKIKEEFQLSVKRAGLLGSQHEKELAAFDEKHVDPFLKKHYPDLSKAKLWMLVLDARDHKYGSNCYNKGKNTTQIAEPHFVEASINALLFMLKTRCFVKEISVDYMKKIHRLALIDVKRNYRAPIITSKEEHKILEFTGAMFTLSGPLNPEKIKGIKESCADKFQAEGNYQNKFYKKSNEILKEIKEKGFFKVLQLDPKDIPREVRYPTHEVQDTYYCDLLESLIKSYYQKQKGINSPDEHILNIAKFCKRTEFLHPGSDGNIRMLRIVMLKLLADAGLSFTCMHNPNDLGTWPK